MWTAEACLGKRRASEGKPSQSTQGWQDYSHPLPFMKSASFSMSASLNE